jgi:hypothetical protein
MRHWSDYPAAVIKATPEQVGAALAAHYETVPTNELAKAYTNVARGVALFEETPRGTLGTALRGHLNIIVVEQQSRGEATT